MHFSVSYHDVDNIALSEQEITAMLNVDLSEKENRYLIPQQERFSIAYNFLLRFNDSISINEKNIFIEEGQPFFKMITGKTKASVIIPIMPRNYEILKKNGFKMRAISNQKTNDAIKELGRLAGITSDHTVSEVRKGKVVQVTDKRYNFITTHTTRRSAATNLYLAGVDLKSIQLMGGWKSLKQLEDYLKIDKLENAKKLAGHAFFNR
jgi:site-specific recombinase XerD